MVKTYGEIYREVKNILQSEEGDNAAFTARELLSHVSGYEPAALMAMQSIYVSEQVQQQYYAAANRILAGEPLAYILGKWSFCGIDLTVTPDVLIPRDDTMAVVELVVEHRDLLPANPRILDLCTGSGCIGLALASQIKDARVTLADVSAPALKIAKKNVSEAKLSGRVTCFQADVLRPASEFLGKFDLIVSNPPYITTAEMIVLQRSVRDYEPHLALWGGDDGLVFYRAILRNYAEAVKPGGWICFEFGQGQETDICQLLKENNFIFRDLKRDTGNIIRALLAQKKERYDNYGSR